MIKKIIVCAGLSLSAITASAASLTLINYEPYQIQVTCNGTAGIPIPPAQSGQGEKLTLPYFLIAARFGSDDVKCTFSDDAGHQGHAELLISDYYTEAQIQSYDPKDGGIIIDPMSSLTTPTSDITVTLHNL